LLKLKDFFLSKDFYFNQRVYEEDDQQFSGYVVVCNDAGLDGKVMKVML
jgi:hypothetical protein